jgi:heme-degrading monooxygenase HmoA
MHAVVVKVNIGDPETAEQGLRDQVVPRASNAPGFVSGYWTRSDDGHNGLSMVVFESEESARSAAEMIQGPQAMRPATVTLESVEVREVVANA